MMMKNLVGAAALSVGILMSGGIANASVIFLDFEDGVNQGSSTNLGNSALQTYLESSLGRTNVDAGDFRYFGSSNTFGSDGLFTQGYSSTLDFDTDHRSANDWFIESLSFEWAVLDGTPGRDFGLDVFSDHDNRWHNNFFTLRGISAPPAQTGYSGLLVLPDTWQVTRLRIHDSGTYDVGMDNLRFTDNHDAVAVPEPNTLALFGFGIAALTWVRRRRKSM